MTTDAPLLGEPLAVELMNTRWADRFGEYDSLATVDGALGWLTAVAPRTPTLMPDEPAGLSDAEAARAARSVRRLRDALRCLAAEVTADDRSGGRSPLDVDSALASLNATASSSPPYDAVELGADGALVHAVRGRGGPLATALATIAGEGARLLGGDPAGPLRACYAPGCVLYFVQHHPRREWCSAQCGNRARVARHYRRHSGATATD